eukprot:3142622-Rhodomonas_salina.2
MDPACGGCRQGGSGREASWVSWPAAAGHRQTRANRAIIVSSSGKLPIPARSGRTRRLFRRRIWEQERRLR